jgi:AraC-like DNA-binding protein
MKDFEIIKKLVGEKITKAELEYVDCYVQKNMGLFIPSIGACGYAVRQKHTHPSYMVIICFYDAKVKATHYPAEIYSPGIPHDDSDDKHFYCLLINKDFFESQYRLYTDEPAYFAPQKFEICTDILKTLNTFAFEYSKAMMNSDITLGAQATIVTHWIIRSILGENLDMRAVSSEYSVARAQHYIEQHFPEKITSDDLAKLGYMSVSSLNRKFRTETGKTPIEYLIDVRIEHSKALLRRQNIPITEIAVRCGFSSSSHFSSCFAGRIGITPSEYQLKYIE